nr:hypothetical protein [Tanacetum cinerariifolium]
MADKEKKSTMKGFETTDQADYYSGITSITVNGKNAYELKRNFLYDLHNNAFSGALWDYWKLGSDAVEPTNEKTLNLEETNQVCTVRRFEMIKYSFGQDEEYVAVKEDEYEDLTNGFKIINGDRNECEYENEPEYDERYELCGNETHEFPVCTARRFEMIKYSFGQDEEYVAVKEDEYEDLTSTSEDVCRAYQEIFCMMDEGCMVIRAE